jgi:elongation factor 1-gamma
MAFGTLFTTGDNPRSTAIKVVAKANNVDLTIVEADTTNPTVEHLKAHPLGKIPAFLGEDGFALSECIAVAIYITSQNEKTTLLGKTKQDYASILKWMSYFNTEIVPVLGSWFRPLVGKDPYNKKSVDEASKRALKNVKVVDDYLVRHTYLVGDRITLADIFAAGTIFRGFQYFFDKEWREAHPNVTRWYQTIINQPIYADVAPKVEFIEKPLLTNVAPKVAKPDAPKAAPKAAAPAPAADEPDAPKPPKHPLAALPPISLDDWKRYFSNHDEADSMKHFWETTDFNEFSIWRVDYKYNDELTLTFMSNNLIGGFNTRLEASRKYIFGSASVYGESNNSVIQGAFVIRGQDYIPVFDVAPDYESYSFTKLDPTKPEDREFVEAMWKWDKPVVVDGKEYAHADGKVFK